MSHFLNRSDRFYLTVQKLVDWLFFPLVGISSTVFIRWIRNNRVQNHKALRAQFQEILKNGKPTIICSNHLTMFDSIYIQYAFNNAIGYFFHFGQFSWNVPAVEVFKTTLFMKAFTYLGKCIPIDRQGDAAHHKQVLARLKYLMLNREVVTLFPEGGRSRTGYLDVENITYGVGNILKELSDYQVICVYMRGLNHRGYTPLPPRGDEIYFQAEVIEPRTEQSGIRASKEISVQIMTKLHEMEKRYLQQYGKDDGASARE